MDVAHEKTANIDSIENVSNDSLHGAPQLSDADEKIIYDLQHHGEEIGLTFRTIMAAMTMGSCYNAYLLTLLIPPAILSFVNAELGPDPRYTWITGAWNLGGAIFVTIGGRMSDIFGRRYFFLAGAALLIVGSIVSATGKTIDQMIAGGALFGAGSGFLEMTFGAVQEIVPNKHRGITIGLFDASSIIAQMMPLTAWGIIATTGSWRISYYIMIGFQTFNLAFLFLFYNPPSFKTKHRNDGKSKGQLLREFDWVGLFLFIAGCTLFIVGLSWGGTLHPWTSGATIGPIVTGFMTLIALGFWECYAPITEPLLPPRLFRQKRHFLAPIVTMGIAGMQYYSNATLWPRLSQLLYAHDSVSKGMYAETLPLGTILGGIVMCFSKKIGHQRWQVFAAIALQTACVGAMSTATLDNPVKSVILTVIISFCTSMVILNCLVTVGFGILDQDDIGTAAGIAGTSRLICGAVAIAIFSNVTNGKYADELRPHVIKHIEGLGFAAAGLPKLVAAAKAGTAAAYAAVPGLTPAVRAATVLANKEAYLEAAHLSYQVALAFGLCGCIAALFIPSIDSRKYTKKTVALQEADRRALEEKKGQVTA